MPFSFRWYERARERVWKKYGAQINNSIEIKRAYESKGLLGYKVWIDGFNNTFDASNEPIYRVASGRKSQIDQEEREKILKMEASLENFSVDEQQLPTPPAAIISLQETRHRPILVQRGLMGEKLQAIDLASTISSVVIHEASNSSLDLSSTEDSTSVTDLTYPILKSIVANPTSLEPTEGKLHQRVSALHNPRT